MFSQTPALPHLACLGYIPRLHLPASHRALTSSMLVYRGCAEDCAGKLHHPRGLAPQRAVPRPCAPYLRGGPHGAHHPGRHSAAPLVPAEPAAAAAGAPAPFTRSTPFSAPCCCQHSACKPFAGRHFHFPNSCIMRGRLYILKHCSGNADIIRGKRLRMYGLVFHYCAGPLAARSRAGPRSTGGGDTARGSEGPHCVTAAGCWAADCRGS